MLTPGSFRAEPNLTVIRKDALLTTSYVLCQAHCDGSAKAPVNGDIHIAAASQITFWMHAKFGSTPATSIDLKSVFLPARRGYADTTSAATIATGFFTWTDLQTDTPWTAIEDGAAGGLFAQWMVGHQLHISGDVGNLNAGSYEITGYTDGDNITIGSACGDTGACDNGVGFVHSQFQEMEILTSGGVSKVRPHIIQLDETQFPAAAEDGLYCCTFPLPAAPFMRVYARCQGTATASSLWLAYSLMPEGGK